MLSKIKKQYLLIDHEEQANVWTHGTMLLLAVCFSPFLILQANTVSTGIGLIAFCLGMMFMLLSSTTFHLMSDPELKEKWQLIDHISIFVLISCSYTAFFVYHYNTADGYKFLALHWSISIIGIIFKIWTKDKFRWLSLVLYLVLGVMVAFVFEQATGHMSSAVYNNLMLGGAGYLIGVVFYAWDKLKFNHAIWHIGVNVGVVTHFIALYQS